jgi:hypothetical protein
VSNWRRIIFSNSSISGGGDTRVEQAEPRRDGEVK